MRSHLCREVLDALHGHGVEIVSPTFMNQRPIPTDGRVIPSAVAEAPATEEEKAPEDIMFDKAERAERIEKHQGNLQAEVAEIEGRLAKAKGEEHSALKAELARRQKQLAVLADVKAEGPQKSEERADARGAE